MKNPEVTVLMAVYKDAPFVRQAVDSILNQTFTDFEYIIVNDGSPDGSRDIVGTYSDPRIRIIDNPHNMGHPLSLNRGLAAARGELIARFDANDICLPDRLEKQVRYMREHPDVALVGGQIVAIDVDGTRIRRAEFRKPVTEIGIKWYFMFDSPFIHPATMYRKSIVDRLGGYNNAWTGEEDAELWTRIAAEHRVANLRDVLVYLRHDPRSTTYDTSQPYRAGYIARITGYCLMNMKRYLQTNDIAEEWGRVCTEVVFGGTSINHEMALRFIEIVDSAEERFGALYAGAARNPEVAAFKAQLESRALFRLAAVSRFTACRIFVRMIRSHPPTAFKFFPKFLAYLVFKSKAGSGWNWWRSRRIARSVERHTGTVMK